ncbi:hypothetical protein LZ017_09405 [Pelomonas sp. CA6]|nr:hypothetical protein [Pelomonas sp. CA6]MCH7343593.1 hypothetical protein [Pelomonas sp. CA6]
MSSVDNEPFPGLQNLTEYSTTPVAYVTRSVFEDEHEGLLIADLPPENG